jgi:dTDP-4-dehydrorhamnose reductase
VAKLLITGGSGLLGSNLIQLSREKHEVIAVYHRHAIQHPEVKALSADLSTQGTAERLIKEIRPDWIIHGAAATNVDRCEREPEVAFRHNRDMARWVAHAGAEVGARLIHISTDAVFPGDRAGYSEEDETSPINVYGRSKGEGEEAVLEVHPDAIVARTNFYGWNAQEKLSLAEWFLDQLREGKPCRGFKDVFVKPLLVNDLASLLLSMLRKGLSGIYHVLGSECISKYELGIRIGRVFGLSASSIEPVSVDDVGLTAPRPRNLCLRTEKIMRALGNELPGIEDGLRRFCELEKTGYRDQLKTMISTEGNPQAFQG